MTCTDCRPLLHAHVDGELDLVTDMSVTAHLRECPACARQHEGLLALRQAVGSHASRYALPLALRQAISLSAGPQPIGPSRPSARLPGALAMAASLAIALVAGYSAARYRMHSTVLSDEGLDAHIRSLQAMHPMDVISTDRHTVKPWFAGKVDFSPPVFDLAEAGYPLAGGRLEAVDGQTAAALIYHRNLHTISVFIWRGNTAASPESKYGYSAVGWSHHGLSFLAVSDIPAAELAQFVSLYRSQAD